MRICERCDGDGYEPDTGEVIPVGDAFTGWTVEALNARLCKGCGGSGHQWLDCRSCGSPGRGAFCSRACFLGVFGEWRAGDPAPTRYDEDGDPIEGYGPDDRADMVALSPEAIEALGDAAARVADGFAQVGEAMGRAAERLTHNLGEAFSRAFEPQKPKKR